MKSREDLFKLITLSLNEKKKIKEIKAIPLNDLRLSEMRTISGDGRMHLCTPFLWAVWKSQFTLAKALLERGADYQKPCYMKPLLNKKDIECIAPVADTKSAIEGLREVAALEMICAKNAVELLRYMHANKFIKDVNQVLNHAGQSMMHVAAKYGHCDLVRLIASFEHVDINVADSRGLRPLSLACDNGLIEMVKTLLELKVSIDFDVSDLKFLVWVELNSKQEDNQKLQVITGEPVPNSLVNRRKVLQLFQDQIPSDAVRLQNLIILIEKKSFAAVLKMLESYTGDIDALSHKGRALLHRVAEYADDTNNDGYLLAQALIKRKAKIDVRTRALRKEEDDGFTPFLLACEHGHMRIMLLLVLNGAKIDSCTEFQQTALHLAALRGQVKVVNYLCAQYKKMQLNINPLTTSQSSPLHFALVRRYTEVVKILLSFGADPTLVAKNGSAINMSISKEYGQFVPEILTELIKASLQYIPKKNNSEKVQVELVEVETPAKPAETVPDFFMPKEFDLLSFGVGPQLCLSSNEKVFQNLSYCVRNVKELRNSVIRAHNAIKDYEEAFAVLGKWPILLAINEQCLPAMEILMQYEYYRSVPEQSDFDMLYFAILCNKAKSVEMILKTKMSQSAAPEITIEPRFLFVAMLLNNPKVLDVLLKYGRFDEEIKLQFGLLILVLFFADTESLAVFIRHGFNFDDKDNRFPFSCLEFLIANKKLDLARILITSKCIDINKRLEGRSTALMQACLLDDIVSSRFVELLLKHEADITIKHHTGLNALHLALIVKNHDIARKLILHNPSLIAHELIHLSNGKKTTLAHLCIVFEAFWLLRHPRLATVSAFMQEDSSGLSVRQLANHCEADLIQYIDKICVNHAQHVTYEPSSTQRDIYTGRQYLISVLGFSPDDIKSQQQIKPKKPEQPLGRDSPILSRSPLTYFAGRLTLKENFPLLRRADTQILVCADWQAIGVINEEDMKNFVEVLAKPKLVVHGAGVKFIGHKTMDIQLTENEPTTQLDCCYEIKITSKARLLCALVKPDNPTHPMLLIACHYMPKGMHTRQDSKRVEDIIQKRFHILDADRQNLETRRFE